MRYRSVDGIDKPLSQLVQGTELFKSWEPEAAFALLDAVADAGGTVFDTAHMYGEGHCERILGRWLARQGDRHRFVIISKGAHPHADRRRVTPLDIASDLHDSLSRLGVDHIDLYLLHRDDPSVPVEPIMEALHDHVQAGRIGAIGASNWSHLRIEEANAHATANGLTPFVVSSPHFSLAEQESPPWDGCLSITGDSNSDARAWYATEGIPIFSWASLSLGFLSGRYSRDDLKADSDPLCLQSFGSEENFTRLDRAHHLARLKGLSVPQIAIAWLIGQPMEVFPIIASATTEEFLANRDATEVLLTPEELSWLSLLSDRRS